MMKATSAVVIILTPKAQNEIEKVAKAIPCDYCLGK
jgi:hypothetical protein